MASLRLPINLPKSVVKHLYVTFHLLLMSEGESIAKASPYLRKILEIVSLNVIFVIEGT